MAAHANLTSHPSSRPLIAPAWHTIGLVAIFVGLSVVGGFFQHAAKQHPQAAMPRANAVPGYVSVLISEWLLVLYVRAGVHKRSVRLRDLVGGRWASPKDVVKDIALAAALWALWTFLQNPHILGGTNAAQGLLPQGLLESLVWIPLALSAGFCEELVFRGYLQKQFQAVTGNAGLAVLFQAIVFGVGHLYEGIAPVGLITLYGVLFGLLAVWRKSLRPGMIAHAWSDIFGVIIFRGMYPHGQPSSVVSSPEAALRPWICRLLLKSHFRRQVLIGRIARHWMQGTHRPRDPASIVGDVSRRCAPKSS